MATKTLWKLLGEGGGIVELREVNGAAELLLDSAVSLAGTKLVALTADASLTQASHAGRIVTLGSADGDTVTLPAATGTGDVYTVVVATTVTSNSHIIQVANATDEFRGVVYQVDTDTSDTLAAYPALDADGFDTITMDGTTTGGLSGDKFIFTDIASGVWQLEGHSNASGTVATPLSAAVS